MSRCPTPRPSVQLLWGNRQPITALASEPAGTRRSARPRNAFLCNSQPKFCKSVKKFRTRADVVIFTVTGQLFVKKIRLELEGPCTRHVSPLIMTTGPIYQAGTQRSDAAGGVTIICCIRTLLFDSGQRRQRESMSSSLESAELARRLETSSSLRRPGARLLRAPADSLAHRSSRSIPHHYSTRSVAWSPCWSLATLA